MSHVLNTLRDPATIRLRCGAITQAVADNLSPWFRLDLDRLDNAAARVEAVMRRRFPDLKTPYHSRWRHFEAGGVNRKAELDALLAGRSVAERTRAMFDLTVVSVLLDAGAGPKWRYVERSGGSAPSAALPAHRQSREQLMAMLDQAVAAAETPVPAAEAVAEAPAAAPPAADSYTRSEGLGVASFRGFIDGVFSSTANDPLRADAATLKTLDAAALRALFQASPSNPMVGLDGRAGLLARLGQALEVEAAKDGLPARPSLVADRVTAGFTRQQVSAAELLQEVLRAYAPIWTSGSRVQGALAGDVWPHRWAGDATGSGPDAVTAGWVPFHKLSQWLTYSLLEPLEWAGVQVTGLDALTGLPEYRNGGLLIDEGVIVLRQSGDLMRSWKPSDELIIEWRALTITLLDRLADRVRQRLGLSAEQLPLACVLEGGTWAAGREIAAEKRAGAPPFSIESDGTIF